MPCRDISEQAAVKGRFPWRRQEWSQPLATQSPTSIGSPCTKMPKPTPQQQALIRDLYLALVEEPWFNRNVVTEKELLKMLHANCAGVDDDAAELETRCRTEARHRFSKRR